MVKEILTETEKRIYTTLFNGWYSKIELSEKEKISNKTSIYYINHFIKKDWIESEYILKEFPRKNKKGIEGIYRDRKLRHKTNYNVFFKSKIETELKKFLIFFLEKSRHYLSDAYPDDIPSGIEEVIKQLFLTSVILKKNRIKGIFNISGITLENFKERIQEEINKYYLERMESKKKGKAYSKGLKEIYPERTFWLFLNLFSLVMAKLFFNKEFKNEVVKTSPDIYFWLCKLYGQDFDFYL